MKQNQNLPLNTLQHEQITIPGRKSMATDTNLAESRAVPEGEGDAHCNGNLWQEPELELGGPDSLSADYVSISKKTQILLRQELNHLRIRESHFLNAVYWKETKLDRLKAALDKLNFAKTTAYKRGSTSSSTSSSGECDFHSVRHWMLHGCSNLATENKLLKQIPGIQHDKIDSSILVASINMHVRLSGCMHERKSAIVKQQCRRLKQMVAEISAVNACRN
ncbi:Uncharacterized protein TCM_019817 [Theobroma cacao]|uniref:Uncharacterized protein n=1 Tax=Theobroma cacao TaxID=3641 RepID=A0A061EIA8_THECC|nr:Uncharacterized protein TCM_019817 [Theobroma cacao]